MKSLKSLLGLPYRDDVMTYPEITKKISTPRYPPGRMSLLKWLMMTATTANALSPSISGLYLVLLACAWDCVGDMGFAKVIPRGRVRLLLHAHIWILRFGAFNAILGGQYAISALVSTKLRVIQSNEMGFPSAV